MLIHCGGALHHNTIDGNGLPSSEQHNVSQVELFERDFNFNVVFYHPHCGGLLAQEVRQVMAGYGLGEKFKLLAEPPEEESNRSDQIKATKPHI